MEKKAIAAAAEALKKTRVQVSEDEQAEGKYGKALDEIVGQLEKLADIVKGDDAGSGDDAGAGNDAPPPAKTGEEAEPEKKDNPCPEKEGEGEEEDEARYKGGKMSESEKKIYEDNLRLKEEIKIRESRDFVAKSLRESGLPAGTYDDLKEVLIGKDQKYVKKLIEARKKFLEAMVDNKAFGAGGKAGEGETSKMKESLGKAGIPLKEVKK